MRKTLVIIKIISIGTLILSLCGFLLFLEYLGKFPIELFGLSIGGICLSTMCLIVSIILIVIQDNKVK